MAGIPQRNKLPASLNLTGLSSQFLEQGDEDIVSEVLGSIFNQYFESTRMQYAYFCDFSVHHPWQVDETARNIASFADTAIISDFTIPGFLGTGTENIETSSYRGYISQYIPFAICKDEFGNRTTAFSMRLRAYTGVTLIGNWPGSAPPYDGYYYPNAITAGLVVPASTDGGGGAGETISYATNVKYELRITPSSGSITIEAFGLLYNAGVLSP